MIRTDDSTPWTSANWQEINLGTLKFYRWVWIGGAFSSATMSASAPSTRLVSLDVLRGFDMCWILGLGAVTKSLLNRLLPDSSLNTAILPQLEHVEWAGFRFYDLIFPLFLFISGVSMAMALPARVAREGRGQAVRHLLARALILVALGIFVSGGLRDGWEKIRWLGVLQRIGIASAIAGLLSLVLGWRGLLIVVVSLLGGYCLLLGFVPVPGIGAGDFAEGRNLTNYLDSIWLPGRKYDGNHDPEGLLSTFPAVATALLGLLAGKWLSASMPVPRKVLGLIMAGVAMLLLGWAWHPFFPVIKKIWSSSFVLVAAGWSALLLGVFYWLVDGLGWRRWTAPFLWVGANPILLYIFSGLGFFRLVADRLVSASSQDWAWLPACVSFALMLLLARWLWRRGLFIKV
jgi:predicted acyltransferase